MSGDTLFIKALRNASLKRSANFTRPADTNVYAAGDVICNSTSAPVVLTFANMARAPGLGGVIQNSRMIFDEAPTLKLDSILYLFDTSPTIQNDNAAWAPTTANLRNLVGKLAFSLYGFVTGSSNGEIENGNQAISYTCATTDTSLYGILVAQNAYVPGSGKRYDIIFQTIQD